MRAGDRRAVRRESVGAAGGHRRRRCSLETADVEAGDPRPARPRGVVHRFRPCGGGRRGAIAASEIKPAVLELGGSDPCIVLADADLDEAAADVITLSRIINAGQSCIAAKRMIVEASVHDEFVDLLQRPAARARASATRARRPTDVGPTRPRRPARRRCTARSQDHGRRRRARACSAGRCPTATGFFYPVTLLTEVTARHGCVFRGDLRTRSPWCVPRRRGGGASRCANDTPYGLAARLDRTTDRGEAMAADIEAGQVVVNGIVKTDPRLPSGGIKRSGYGRELGPHGIHEFVNAQQVWIGPVKS
ncbi:MAG: aldehyde dehydrogenase family protein [Woeseiaceae bacterium]|nr:aldehyde dehydrogenase family protein [Woeseiaceae bacterium]